MTDQGFAVVCPLGQSQRVATEMGLIVCMGGSGGGAKGKESCRGAKASLGSDTGTERGQGQQGCQALIVLIEMTHLY